MTISLVASALLTILSAILPGWTTLLVMRALTGIALAGVPSVATAYVAEEVDAVSVGSATGLYIAGSAIGGMAGRVGRAKLFWMPIVGMVAGIALTAAAPLSVIVLGIAVITAAFFAAHSTASGWVGGRAGRDRAQASATAQG